MDPVVLTEPFQMSAEWSWVFVAWLFPMGPVAFAAWLLASAVKFERQRRLVVAPPPGYSLVEGTIRHERNQAAPAVQATFELEAKRTKGVTAYYPRAHTISVRPFTIETDGGEHVNVRPERDAVALHAPVAGEHTSRFSRVVAGERVWVYGPASVITSKQQGRPAAKREQRSEGKPRLLVSTQPIAEVFRAERNRRVGLATAVVVFLLAAQLVVFGGYWDILRAGTPAVGLIEGRSYQSHERRERTGGSHREVEYTVALAAGARRGQLEVSPNNWTQIDEGTKVALLLSPTAMMLGPAPHTTISRCLVMSALLVFGLVGFALAALYQRPWYATTRGWRGFDRPPRAAIASSDPSSRA
jgi:hypothetical protein